MSIDFEPVKLDPRRRRIDPVVVGAVVVVIALVAAVIKPWEQGASPDGPDSSPVARIAASGVPGASATPGPSNPRAEGRKASALPRSLTPPSWSDVGPIIVQRVEWGIRAIVMEHAPYGAAGGPSERFTESWVPMPTIADGTESQLVDGHDNAIVALGITFPPEDTPVDARIWQVHGNGQLEWIDAQSIDAVPFGGAFLFAPPVVAGAELRTWGSGHYRIDVLVDGRVRRIAVEIPGRFGNVPEPGDWPVEQRNLVDPSATDPSSVQAGLFATVDGSGVPLAAANGPLLDEVGAWLDVDPGTTQAPRAHVASAFLPRATGLGVMLPPGSTVRTADLHRLAPDLGLGSPATFAGGISSIHSRQPYVVFAPPGGGVWTPGVYAVSVDWKDAGGIHRRTWHAELRPGPLRETPRLLAAVRAWARYAGMSSLVLGDGIGCGATHIPDTPGVIGFAHPVDATPDSVSATIIVPPGRVGDLPLLTVGPTVPGLTIVAPATRPDMRPGVYRFTFDGPDLRRVTVCLGDTPFDR